jgi:hypothetical protein
VRSIAIITHFARSTPLGCHIQEKEFEWAQPYTLIRDDEEDSVLYNPITTTAVFMLHTPAFNDFANNL